jgi:pimeloyl-ACP methyl ester carboxylesterase
VGVAKRKFLARLRDHDTEMAVIFQDPEFLRWIDVLQRTRHYVAHQGTAMLSLLFEKLTHEPSEPEIDRDIEQWAEWGELERRWPPAMMETFRPIFRAKWYARNHRQISDAAFVIHGATDSAIIFPLQNIEWEYERFRNFALAVTAKCSARLESRPDMARCQPRRNTVFRLDGQAGYQGPGCNLNNCSSPVFAQRRM